IVATLPSILTHSWSFVYFSSDGVFILSQNLIMISNLLQLSIYHKLLGSVFTTYPTVLSSSSKNYKFFRICFTNSSTESSLDDLRIRSAIFSDVRFGIPKTSIAERA